MAAGTLIRPHAGVLALPHRFEEWHTKTLAAFYATGGALSHATALAIWRLGPKESPIHVSITGGRRALKSRGLVVHRVRDLDPDRVGGLPVTSIPRTLVDTWGEAHRRGGRSRAVRLSRAAVIEALRERRIRPRDLHVELSAQPGLPGRAELLKLIAYIEQGCQSELEIWGVREVLHAPGMPQFVQQHPVVLRSGTVHLDAAVPEVKVAIEMDGAAYHGSPEARERDIRRDAALAAQGWVVLRFSYRRLTEDPEGCRREILAVCAARRAQLRTK